MIDQVELLAKGNEAIVVVNHSPILNKCLKSSDATRGKSCQEVIMGVIRPFSKTPYVSCAIEP